MKAQYDKIKGKYHSASFERRYRENKDHTRHETVNEKETRHAGELVELISQWLGTKSPTVKSLIDALKILYSGKNLDPIISILDDNLRRKGRL
jgi:hypothetical protein